MGDKISMAMTQNFVRLATDDTEWDYIEFRQLEEPKTVTVEEMEGFDYTILKGYHWYTLACRTRSVCDLYRVYDENWGLILETEDPVVELPSRFTPNEYMTVKGYDRYGDNKLIKIAEDRGRVTLSDRQTTDNYKLSVVVPLYKAELFMCRTIDSILSSSLDSIELILVNDWSPENDLQIANRYATNYWCVKVIDKPNTWLCDTRNKWLEVCQWEYMAFCDADDIIHPLMYETLFNAAKKENTDIAISSILIRNQPNKYEWSLKLDHDVVCDFEEMAAKKDTHENIYFVGVRNKIVKTETARKVRFTTEYIWRSFVYEDIAYTWSLYSYIDKFAYCCDAIYIREKRKRQTVGTVSTRHRNVDSNEYSWETFIYGASYPLYNKSGKHLERHDFIHFKRLIESYKKFQTPSPLKTYWDMKLKELINSQKLYDNRLIMDDKELSLVVTRLK